MATILCPSIGDWTDDLGLIQKTECVMAAKMNALQLNSTTWVGLIDRGTGTVGKCRPSNSIPPKFKGMQNRIVQDCTHP